jgi:hypothetical protein
MNGPGVRPGRAITSAPGCRPVGSQRGGGESRSRGENGGPGGQAEEPAVSGGAIRMLAVQPPIFAADG